MGYVEPSPAPGAAVSRTRTIAVGAGGGPAGWQTLAWAVAEASSTGSRLVVCHVCPADSPLAKRGDQAPLSVLELTDPALARAVGAARGVLGARRVDLTIHTGHVGRALVAVAERADLLVVGPPTRVDWAARPSTTHHVVRHTPGPLVVVRPRRTSPGSPFAGHVVVGIDGSRSARAALGFAFQWADEHHRPLAAVHVTTRDQEDVWFDERMLQTHFTAEPAGMALLAEETERCRAEYPRVEVKRALFGGRPAEGLVRAAAGAEMLAVGDRGQGPAARAILGSVAHALVTRADGPLAVVHAGPPLVPLAAGRVYGHERPARR